MSGRTMWAEWEIVEYSRANAQEPWNSLGAVDRGKGAVVIADGEDVRDVLMRRGMTSGGALRRRDLEVLQSRVMA